MNQRHSLNFWILRVEIELLLASSIKADFRVTNKYSTSNGFELNNLNLRKTQYEIEIMQPCIRNSMNTFLLLFSEQDYLTNITWFDNASGPTNQICIKF